MSCGLVRGVDQADYGSKAIWRQFTFPSEVKVRKVASASWVLLHWRMDLGAGIWWAEAGAPHPFLSLCAQEHSQLALLESSTRHTQAQDWSQRAVNSTLLTFCSNNTPKEMCGYSKLGVVNRVHKSRDE